MCDPQISVTVDWAARVTGLTRNQVMQAIRAGELETAVIGPRRLVMFASLEQYINKHKISGRDGVERRSK